MYGKRKTSYNIFTPTESPSVERNFVYFWCSVTYQGHTHLREVIKINNLRGTLIYK